MNVLKGNNMEITQNKKNVGHIDFYSDKGFKELNLRVRTNEYDQEDWDFIRNLYYEIRTYLEDKYVMK